MADIIINAYLTSKIQTKSFYERVNKRNTVPVEGMKGNGKCRHRNWMIAELMITPVRLSQTLFSLLIRPKSPKLTLPEIDEFLDSGDDIDKSI